MPNLITEQEDKDSHHVTIAFSENTGRIRRNLLFVSSLSLAATYFSLDLESSHLWGMKFQNIDNNKVSLVLMLLVAYHLISFLLHFVGEYKRADTYIREKEYLESDEYKLVEKVTGEFDELEEQIEKEEVRLGDLKHEIEKLENEKANISESKLPAKNAEIDKGRVGSKMITVNIKKLTGQKKVRLDASIKHFKRMKKIEAEISNATGGISMRESFVREFTKLANVEFMRIWVWEFGVPVFIALVAMGSLRWI